MPNASLSPRNTTNKFLFMKYDPTSSDAESQLMSCALHETLVGTPSMKTLRHTCDLLRDAKITLTTAFIALCLKTAALLIQEDDDLSWTDKSTLLAANGVDTRKLGKWPKGSRSYSGSSLQWPIVANYSFGASTPVTIDDCLDKPLEEIARMIKVTSICRGTVTVIVVGATLSHYVGTTNTTKTNYIIIIIMKMKRHHLID